MDEPAPNVGAGSLDGWERVAGGDSAATQVTVMTTGVASPPGELIV
jgi:hypothetical protein